MPKTKNTEPEYFVFNVTWDNGTDTQEIISVYPNRTISDARELLLDEMDVETGARADTAEFVRYTTVPERYRH